MSPEYRRVVAADVPGTASATRVRMRDGVHLATDVYLPEGAHEAAAGPTILIRTPYDKSGALTPLPLIAEYYTGRGYRVVAQDVRGKFRSEGESLQFVNEARDGSDTLDWIVRQPWSDGSVGMAGNSYYGFTQWAAMSTNHPALKAISPRLTGTRLGEYPTAHGDGRTRDAMMNVVLTYPLTMFATNDTFLWEIDWERRPWTDQAEEFFAAIGERAPSYDLWQPHPTIVRRFPEGHPFDARPIPVLQTIGWWDNCAPWSWSDYETLAAQPSWHGMLHLLVEPIDHYSFELGGDDHDVPATADRWRSRFARILGPTADFFDVHVRGLTPAEPIPLVRWTLSPVGEVRAESSWPPVGVRARALHAQADGTLADAPALAEETMTWVHDPASPVPSAIPDPFYYLLTSPDENQRAHHPGVVVFESDPLDLNLDVVGRVRAIGTFGSSGPNMDVHVRLLDVAPDGSATRIARGGIHLFDAREPVRVEIGMDHAGYRVRAGHRLAVHVASSDAPEYYTQPGTGEDAWQARETTGNTQSLRVGGQDGLRIVFDVLPADAESAR